LETKIREEQRFRTENKLIDQINKDFAVCGR
jgi:hypothetical protein